MKQIKAAWLVLTGKLTAIPASFEREDAIAGHFSIATSKNFTRINVQGREFFFTRDGKFDGTGSGCCKPRRVRLLLAKK